MIRNIAETPVYGRAAQEPPRMHCFFIGHIGLPG